MTREILNRNDFVRVVNETDEDIEGRHDGYDYVFRRAEHTDVPLVVAQHVFGFGMKDKSQALARLGWARSSDELKAATARLHKIRFDELPDVIDFRRQSGSAAPVATAGGTKALPAASPVGSADEPATHSEAI